jgi:hypothetical protein
VSGVRAQMNEARRLIAVARGDHGERYDDTPAVAHLLAEAQVHATLALVEAIQDLGTVVKLSR